MRDLVVLVVLSSATFGSKVLALELSHDLTLVLLGALAIGLMRFGDMHQAANARASFPIRHGGTGIGRFAGFRVQIARFRNFFL